MDRSGEAGTSPSYRILQGAHIPHCSRKDRSTITRWLNAGLQREHDDHDFCLRLDTLDHSISDRETDNAAMRSVA